MRGRKTDRGARGGPASGRGGPGCRPARSADPARSGGASAVRLVPTSRTGMVERTGRVRPPLRMAKPNRRPRSGTEGVPRPPADRADRRRFSALGLKAPSGGDRSSRRGSRCGPTRRESIVASAPASRSLANHLVTRPAGPRPGDARAGPSGNRPTSRIRPASRPAPAMEGGRSHSGSRGGLSQRHGGRLGRIVTWHGPRLAAATELLDASRDRRSSNSTPVGCFRRGSEGPSPSKSSSVGPKSRSGFAPTRRRPPAPASMRRWDS